MNAVRRKTDGTPGQLHLVPGRADEERKDHHVALLVQNIRAAFPNHRVARDGDLITAALKLTRNKPDAVCHLFLHNGFTRGPGASLSDEERQIFFRLQDAHYVLNEDDDDDADNFSDSSSEGGRRGSISGPQSDDEGVAPLRLQADANRHPMPDLSAPLTHQVLAHDHDGIVSVCGVEDAPEHVLEAIWQQVGFELSERRRRACGAQQVEEEEVDLSPSNAHQQHNRITIEVGPDCSDEKQAHEHKQLQVIPLEDGWHDTTGLRQRRGIDHSVSVSQSAHSSGSRSQSAPFQNQSREVSTPNRHGASNRFLPRDRSAASDQSFASETYSSLTNTSTDDQKVDDAQPGSPLHDNLLCEIDDEQPGSPDPHPALDFTSFNQHVHRTAQLREYFCAQSSAPSISPRLRREQPKPYEGSARRPRVIGTHVGDCQAHLDMGSVDQLFSFIASLHVTLEAIEDPKHLLTDRVIFRLRWGAQTSDYAIHRDTRGLVTVLSFKEAFTNFVRQNQFVSADAFVEPDDSKFLLKAELEPDMPHAAKHTVTIPLDEVHLKHLIISHQSDEHRLVLRFPFGFPAQHEECPVAPSHIVLGLHVALT